MNKTPTTLAALLDSITESIDPTPPPGIPPWQALSNPARSSFDPRLAYELALAQEPADAVFARYGYTPEQAAQLSATSLFQASVKRLTDEFKKAGNSFQGKARMLAEALLPHLYDDATDERLHSEDRLKIVQWLAKVGDLEPNKTVAPVSGGGFVLNIVMPGSPTHSISAEPRVIDGERVSIDVPALAGRTTQGE